MIARNNVATAPPEHSTGIICIPISIEPTDLDSGEPLENEDDDTAMKNTVIYTWGC